MPSYRPFPLGKLHTFLGQQAQVLAGGYLKFYQASTTTPANVFGDPALTINNGSQIALDSAGHPAVDMWASTDSAFFVEVYDAADVKQGDLDHVEVPGGAGQVVPVPGTDQLLGGDGDNFVLINVSNRLLPDMTGNANKILGTDGALAQWVSKPANGADGASDIVIGSGSIKWSNGANHVLKQWGSDSVSGGGARSVTKSVTFATPYSATPKVQVTPSGSNASAAGNVEVKVRVSAESTTGFTVTISTITGGTSSDAQSPAVLTGTVGFDWEAIGTTAS